MLHHAPSSRSPVLQALQQFTKATDLFMVACFHCRYFVRTCKRPQERAALALAVRVGSAVESEEEQGVAHIVEHLAFNATEVGRIC